MRVFNTGIGSNNLAGALQYGVKLAKASGARVAVVGIGVNDAVRRRQDFSLEEWANGYERLLTELAAAGLKVYAQTILPVEHAKPLGDTYFDPARIRLMNNAIREIAQKRSITLIDANAAFAGPDGDMPRDMTVDGVHLSTSSYDTLRAVITGAVEPDTAGE